MVMKQKSSEIPTLSHYETAVAGDVKLRGQERISPGCPLVHFAHGNGFCAMTYWPYLRRLPADFGLCLHDAAGHGDSDPGKDFAGWNATAERLAQLVRQRRSSWGASMVIGMGHSFGAVITLLAAARHPGLFDRLLLLDPVPFFLDYGWLKSSRRASSMLLPLNPMARQARDRTPSWTDRENAWNYLYQRGIFRNWSDEALAAYIDYALRHVPDGSVHLKCPPWMEAAIFSTAPSQLWSSVSALNLPTDILFGRSSFPFLERQMRHCTRVNAHIKVHSMEGGHCFMQEYPVSSADKASQLLSTANWLPT